MLSTALCLVGANGSGKSTVCEYLAEKGFVICSLSSILRDKMKKEGIPIHRENLIKHSNRLKSSYGQDILARLAYDVILANDELSHVVFDSVRNMDELDYLKEVGVICIAIDAPLEKRFERTKQRGHDTDSVDFEQFKEQDLRERMGKSSGHHIQATLEECDHLIINDGLVSDLYTQMDQLLEIL